MEQKVHLVDFEEQKQLLAGYPAQTVTALYDFGILLNNEVQQRSSQIDTKLSAYLAAGVAIIALLSAGNMQALSLVARLAVCSSVSTAIVAVAIAALGLRSRLWAFPSEMDWFNQKAIHDSDRLRRAYVLALLAAHRIQHSESASKASTLLNVELFLALSGILAVVSVLTRI